MKFFNAALALTLLMTLAHASTGAECTFGFAGSCIVEVAFSDAHANSSTSVLGCSPFGNLFSTGTFSVEAGKATVLYASTASELVTFDLFTGALLYSVAVDGFDTAYHLAADTSGAEYTVYGTWSSAGSYQLVELNVTDGTARPLSAKGFSPGNDGEKCTVGCDSSDCGWFDGANGLYVTPWLCVAMSTGVSTSYVVSVDVKSRVIKSVLVDGDGVAVFGVSPKTGKVYTSVAHGTGIATISSDGVLTPIISVPAGESPSDIVFVGDDGVCLPRMQDTMFAGDEHPQAEDFVCNSPSSGTALYTVPFFDKFTNLDEIAYFSKTFPGVCHL